jgi:hypothetical protein
LVAGCCWGRPPPAQMTPGLPLLPCPPLCHYCPGVGAGAAGGLAASFSHQPRCAHQRPGCPGCAASTACHCGALCRSALMVKGHMCMRVSSRCKDIAIGSKHQVHGRGGGGEHAWSAACAACRLLGAPHTRQEALAGWASHAPRTWPLELLWRPVLLVLRARRAALPTVTAHVLAPHLPLGR